MNRIVTSVLSIIMSASMLCAAAEVPAEAKKQKLNLFNHMDLGFTVGTTGVGVDVAMPIGDMVKVRTGVAYMPKFNVPLHFDLMTYTDGVVSESKFDKAKVLLDRLAGFEVNQTVTMDCKPNMFTFKLLFDVYPFKTNKHWHFTAGFYLGNKKVGTAINAMKEMPTLVSVGMYNGLYGHIMNTDFMEFPLYKDYYLDPDVADQLKAKFAEMGNIGIHVGDYVSDGANHKKGDPFILKPAEDGTISANALVNVFRPYVGFGYGGTIDKAKRLSVSFDCGAMFWGGSPRIVTYNRVDEYIPDYENQVMNTKVTYEDVDLVRDVENISGKVGDYVKIAKGLKVYPVLNFRIAYAIF